MPSVIWWVLGAGVVFFFLLRQGGVGAISAAEANAWMASQKDLQLVDVRTPEEYREGHLPQALNIPLDQLSGSLGRLKKEKPLLLYCHSGGRSSAALRIVLKAGFTQSKHIRGGISTWRGAGFPVLK